VPDFAEAYQDLGVVYYDLGRADTCKQAIQAINDYFQNCYNLGVTSYNSGRYEEAVDALNKAIAVKPDYSEARF